MPDPARNCPSRLAALAYQAAFWRTGLPSTFTTMFSFRTDISDLWRPFHGDVLHDQLCKDAAAENMLIVHLSADRVPDINDGSPPLVYNGSGYVLGINYTSEHVYLWGPQGFQEDVACDGCFSMTCLHDSAIGLLNEGSQWQNVAVKVSITQLQVWVNGTMRANWRIPLPVPAGHDRMFGIAAYAGTNLSAIVQISKVAFVQGAGASSHWARVAMSAHHAGSPCESTGSGGLQLLAERSAHACVTSVEHGVFKGTCSEHGLHASGLYHKALACHGHVPACR